MLIHSFEAGTIHQTLIEESILGWKEIEVELVRDSNDKTLIIAAYGMCRTGGRAYRRFYNGLPGADSI